MIPPQEAVVKAKTYLLDYTPGEVIEDLRLEELEFEESKNLWLITLGYFRPRQITHTGEMLNRLKRKQTSILGNFLRKEEEKQQDQWALENRIYKRLAIDAENGNFKSMKIREVH